MFTGRCRIALVISSLLVVISITLMNQPVLPTLDAAAPNRLARIDNLTSSTSLKLDASHNPVIAYALAGRLKLAHCANPACSSGTQIQEVDSNLQSTLSLALNHAGNPVISYAAGLLRIVTCGDPNCSAGNRIVMPDRGGNGLGSSLTFDASGNPVVSYTGSGLRLLHCGNPACSSQNSVVVIDNSFGENLGTGLALDESGNPVIAYRSAGTSPKIKLVHCADPNCSSRTINDVDDTDSLEIPTLVLDVAGNPIITYYSFGRKVAHCGDPNCGANNVVKLLDSTAIGGDQGSIVLDRNGNPVLSYAVQQGSADRLTIAHCGDANCSSNNVMVQPDQSKLNGFSSSLQLDQLGRPVVSYQRDKDITHEFLFLLHCGSQTCD
jgi:hypothetical protein